MAQRQFLVRLGVTHLVAVAGPSMGGRQAFQWAVTYPDFVDGVVPVASSPKGIGKDDVVHTLIQRLSTDPNWNDGWYYDRGGISPTLMTLRMETLQRYGIDAILGVQTMPIRRQREARLRRQAEAWARRFDAHSLVVLRKASVRFDAQRDFAPSSPKSSTSCRAATNYSRPPWGRASWADCRRRASTPPTSRSTATLDTSPAAARPISGRPPCEPF